MASWHTTPLTSIALATDGTDPASANLLGHAIVTTTGTPQGGIMQTLVDQQITQTPAPIPAEATAIHGITNQAAALGTTPEDALLSIAGHLNQTQHPVVAFNAPWLFAVLDSMCDRYGFNPIRPGILIDPLVLDKANTSHIRSGGRRLPAVCSRYNVDEPMSGTQSANAHAAGELASTILTTIPKFRRMNPVQLSTACQSWYIEAETEFRTYLRSQGTEPNTEMTPWPSLDLPLAS